MRFEIHNNQLFRFMRTNYALMIGLIGAMTLVLPLIIMLDEGAATRTIWIVLGSIVTFGLVLFGLLVWHARLLTNSLSYEVKDGVLYISEGVLIYQRKAIPLDRVTDFRLVQGLLMRAFGIWKIQVQTAGAAGNIGPEGMMLAVHGPLAARDQLLQMRDSAVKAQRVDPAS